MKKQPLQEDGLQALLQHLYNLPDADLFAKADPITADFKAWIATHFILNELQLSFLNSLDQRFIANIANDSRDFLLQRLPIVLIKDTTALTEDEEKPRGKIIEVTRQNVTNGGVPITYNSNALLIFKISYPILA